MNASVLLCEDCCIFPPGFVLECDVAFSVAEEQSAFFSAGLLPPSIRNDSLTKAIEKKRREYAPHKQNYSGLFNDRRLGFLVDHSPNIVRRSFGAGAKIAKSWREAPDTGSKVWTPVKEGLGFKLLEKISKIPDRLLDSGQAATWDAIEAKLPNNALSAKHELRNALQYAYFKPYVDALDLRVVKNIPYMVHDFGIRPREQAYDFRKFMSALAALKLEDLVLDGSAEFIIDLRSTRVFVEFVDAFIQIAEKAKTIADVKYIFSIASEEANFDWSSAKFRRLKLGRLESINEILDEIGNLEIAVNLLYQEYGLERRSILEHAIQEDGLVTSARIPVELDDVFVVAAHQELRYARQFLRECGFQIRSSDKLVGLGGDYFVLPTEDGGTRTVALLLAGAKGKAKMQQLLEQIFKHQSPSNVIMIGMMAGIRGKVHILDVLSPVAVHDVTGIGTRNGSIVIEPEPSAMDPYLSHWLLRYDWNKKPSKLGMKPDAIIAHKKTLCVPAKWEDYKHEICQKAEDIDRENILGLEMEASALSERQLAQMIDQGTCRFLMIKGVADYAGGLIEEDEIESLKQAGISVDADTWDPIGNKTLRGELQKAATRRSLEIALRVLESLDVSTG